MTLQAVRDPSVEDFLKQAGSLLYSDEATNSLMLGLCDNISHAKLPSAHQPIFIRVLKDGRTVTAAVQTPPRNLVITYAAAEELEFLAKYLKELDAELPGVVGPAQETEAFSIIWAGLSGKKAKLGMNQKIYKIDKVVIPNTAGHLRLAENNETDIVTQWMVEFAKESLPLHEQKSFEERRPDAVRIIENQLAYLWVVDNKPVSMAHVSRHTANGVSVNAVYTPQDFRKKGFASAVVAHLGQTMLDSGKKFCVLYTDLSNPTSNKIYQDLGYKEVSDSKYFIFVAQQ
jgi:predicted GNAT family acetyltransferase